jgi:TolA-binding protein
MTALEPPEPDRLVALTRLARSHVRAPTGAELSRGLEEMQAKVGAARQRTKLVKRVTLLALTLLSGLLLALVVVSRAKERAVPRRPPVAIARVVGGQVLESGYLSELGGGGVRLDFSEGSRFELSPGTRGRLRQIDADGAQLVLDRGTASLRITPNPNGRWSVEAGPFVVSVKGTDFTVRWEPTSERFEVELRRGRVLVSGPVVGADLALRPGQNLSVSLPNRETVISVGPPAGSPVTSSSSPTALPSGEPAPAPPRAVSAASAPSREALGVAPDRRWRDAVAKGEWDLIISDAERAGLEATLGTRSNEELFELADAARYRHRLDVARRALLAARERFPASPRALDAIFLLGRVEEMRSGGKPAALKWYEDYLARAPSGTYAAEALGRKMILVKDTEGPASARRLASEYLERFPRGSYAEAARTLQRSP